MPGAPPTYPQSASAISPGPNTGVGKLGGGCRQVLRSDLAFTLFLSDPASYQGGALVIEEAAGDNEFRLAAGSLLLYPAATLHRVAPVTAGIRRAAVGWMRSLVRDAGHKVFLILDRLQVHRAGLVRAWLDGRQDQIEVFYLPAYSPDLNPDECLNGDVKQAVTARPLARSKGQLKQAVVNHMRSLSRRPERIRSFFHHPQFRYAA